MDLPLSATGLTKRFLIGGEAVLAVDGVSLTVARGEIVAVTGPSGSGKSTLLSLLAGLERPDAGEVHICGQSLFALGEDARAALRCQRVGFVFQSFNLIPALTLAENAALPFMLVGVDELVWRPKVLAALDAVGLAHRAQHLPDQASVGEQQRAAIARALVTEPPLLFADEPTGSLDSARSAEVLRLLEERRDRAGTAILLVTHDPAVAARADRVLVLRDGRIAQ